MNLRRLMKPSHGAQDQARGNERYHTLPTLRGAWTGFRGRERNALFCAAYVRVGSCVTSIAGPNPQRFGVQDRHCRQTFERYSSKPLPQCTSNVSCGSKARITALQQHWPVHLSKRTSRSGKDTCVFGSELRVEQNSWCSAPDLDCESIGERHFLETVEASRGAGVTGIEVGAKGN